MTGPTKFPAPWHSDGRKRDHGARSREAEWRCWQASWSKPINELRNPTGEDFYNVRRNVQGLNRKQCARLLRTSVQSVLNWETGRHPVPFAYYCALLLISESTHYRLASEAWKDWQFIERLSEDAFKQRRGRRDNYITELVNRRTGAHFTPDELNRYHALMRQAVGTIEANAALQAKVDALIAENTDLRTMFRTNGLTDELHAMRERMEGLLARINTAAVVPIRRAAAAE